MPCIKHNIILSSTSKSLAKQILNQVIP